VPDELRLAIAARQVDRSILRELEEEKYSKRLYISSARSIFMERIRVEVVGLRYIFFKGSKLVALSL
jgi:hypothetical protein